jgi:capsular exopolysaccharide synthesis family protein
VYKSRRQGRKLQRVPIERMGEDFPGALVTLSDPTGAAADAYRVLGANLHYALADQSSRVIALTSPGPGEGKTTVCANLGVVLAQADKSVLIVDCDLHKPAMHGVFGVRNLQGLEDVLSGGHRLEEVQHEMMPGLRVVTAGPVPPYPAELLGSRRFKEFSHQVSNEFDYVLVDSPSMSTVPDSLMLTAQSDGVLVVLDAEYTRKEALRRAIHGLEGAGANILGTVVSNVRLGK